MKKEELFEEIGKLEDDLLIRSEQAGQKRRRLVRTVAKYAALAACFVAVIGLGMFFATRKDAHNDTFGSKAADERQDYVKVSQLLKTGGVHDTVLTYKILNLGEWEAEFAKVPAVRYDRLEKSIGEAVEGLQGWYRLLGHEDLQYLVLEEETGYSLWEFESYSAEEYAYQEVLKNIYGIESAADIVKIIVSPANMDNTKEGKKLQKKIGTREITDAKEIEKIYTVLAGMTCYGSNHWDLIGLPGNSAQDMLKQVEMGRYLTLVTADGTEIDSLKYTAISGMFYEYRGIAYNPLSADESDAVEQILGIK